MCVFYCNLSLVRSRLHYVYALDLPAGFPGNPKSKVYISEYATDVKALRGICISLKLLNLLHIKMSPRPITLHVSTVDHQQIFPDAV
jgi:hypothetical protein